MPNTNTKIIYNLGRDGKLHYNEPPFYLKIAPHFWDPYYHNLNPKWRHWIAPHLTHITGSRPYHPPHLAPKGWNKLYIVGNER